MEGEGAGGKASVKCEFKWVKCCSGSRVHWQTFTACPTLCNPSSHWSSACSIQGVESQGGKRMTGTQSAFCSQCSPSSLFPLICPTSPIPSCQIFSSLLWLSTQILTEWDKEKERKKVREKRGERWWDASVFVTWQLGAKGENVALCVCVNLYFCLSVSLCSCECLFTFLLRVQ